MGRVQGYTCPSHGRAAESVTPSLHFSRRSSVRAPERLFRDEVPRNRRRVFRHCREKASALTCLRPEATSERGWKSCRREPFMGPRSQWGDAAMALRKWRVRFPRAPLFVHGGLAHLGEHLLCTQRVTGSSPVASTSFLLGWSTGKAPALHADSWGFKSLTEHTIMGLRTEASVSRRGTGPGVASRRST